MTVDFLSSHHVNSEQLKMCVSCVTSDPSAAEDCLLFALWGDDTDVCGGGQRPCVTSSEADSSILTCERAAEKTIRFWLLETLLGLSPWSERTSLTVRF